MEEAIASQQWLIVDSISGMWKKWKRKEWNRYQLKLSIITYSSTGTSTTPGMKHYAHSAKRTSFSRIGNNAITQCTFLHNTRPEETLTTKEKKKLEKCKRHIANKDKQKKAYLRDKNQIAAGSNDILIVLDFIQLHVQITFFQCLILVLYLYDAHLADHLQKMFVHSYTSLLTNFR